MRELEKKAKDEEEGGGGGGGGPASLPTNHNSLHSGQFNTSNHSAYIQVSSTQPITSAYIQVSSVANHSSIHSGQSNSQSQQLTVKSV